MQNLDWLETYTGVKFNPYAPTANDVDIIDIAHALSQTCRFGGHTLPFYSVARHSINVAKILKAAGHSPKVQLAGLLHDAAEAYLTDIPTPVKRNMPEYRHTESSILQVVYDKCGVTELTASEVEAVDSADKAMLYLEAKRLMRNTDGWAEQFRTYVDSIPNIDDAIITTGFYGFYYDKASFLIHYNELIEEMGHA